MRTSTCIQLTLLGLAAMIACPAIAQTTNTAPAADAPSLAETRVLLDKSIETQQILAKESKEWLEAKELLDSRLELVQKELETVEDKIKETQATTTATDKHHQEVLASIETLKKSAATLVEVVTRLEAKIKTMYPLLPDAVATKLKPLYDRIPSDPANTKVSVAERFQNVLGILSEVGKANNDINTVYEVRTLSSGKPAEVRVVYVGLAQAYYLSAADEAGVGRPTASGWQWEPDASLARNIRKIIEIQEGKQQPTFVSAPCVLQ